MSYILDALRRADAERDRGAVPSVHTRHFVATRPETEERERSRWALWAIVSLSVALVAAIAWNLVGHGPSSAAPTAATTPAPAPMPQVAASQPGLAPAMTPTTLAVAPPLPPSVIPQPGVTAPAVAAVPEKPAPRRTASGAAAPRKGTAAAGGGDAPASGNLVASRTESTGGGRPSPQAAATTGAAEEARNLPEAMRKELPPLTVSGSAYSSNKANRMLLANGQVFHEGDKVAEGLMLQQIKPRGAVFTFKGYRYELPF